MQTGEWEPEQTTGLFETMSVVPLITGVVFPLRTETVQIRMERNRRLLQEAPPDQPILIAYLTDTEKEISSSNLIEIGVAARLVSKLNLPGDVVQVVFQGIRRVRCMQIVQEEPFYRATIARVEEARGDLGEINRLIVQALDAFKRLMEVNRYYQEEEFTVLKMNTEDPGIFADLICSYLNLSYDERKHVIATLDHPARVSLAIHYIEDTIQRALVSKEMSERTQSVIEEGQREFYLRQQLQTIRQMLGEGNEQEADIRALEQRVREAGLEGGIREAVDRQIDRLKMLAPVSQEYQVTRTYIDQLLDVPWTQKTQTQVDIETIRAILDEDHYGLEEAKNRIVEYMAIIRLTGNTRGPILCFVGPPGTGKTSLGKSIARAIGRAYVRMSVGGVRDEAEIRGHRRTYVGAMPGKIVQSLQRAGTCNPVLVIDEIDKMGASPVTGDLASAMLEVLDPEQNAAFMDHYLDLPFDLSQVLFIATANTLYDIPEPLRDRMEVISISGYTEEEKKEISRRHLIPRMLAGHGLGEGSVLFADAAVLRVIREYTREPGLRNFGRRLETVVRKIAVRRSIGDTVPEALEAAGIPTYLGPPRYTPTTEARAPEVGVVNGLGVTGAGGELLLIEALRIPGDGQLIITGQLGDVMRESVLAARSYIQSKAESLDIAPGMFDVCNIHLHFPEGAVPKDGPSAGVAIAIALASLMSGRPVRTDVAMTGEITLRGRVLAVGGIKDKVLAAHRAGVRTVLLPKQNENDVPGIPEAVREELRIVPIEHIDQAIKESIMEVVLARAVSIEQAVQAERGRAAKGRQT